MAVCWSNYKTSFVDYGMDFNLTQKDIARIMGTTQSVSLAYLLNRLRLRDGLPYAASARLAAFAAVVAVGFAVGSTFVRPDLQVPICGTIHIVDAYIIATMGWMSSGDASALRSFRRACFGFGLVQTSAVVGPRVCWSRYAPIFHCVVDHGSIWILFGSVASLAKHLDERPPAPKSHKSKAR